MNKPYACPHCHEPLASVLVMEQSVATWNDQRKGYSKTESPTLLTCMKCGGDIGDTIDNKHIRNDVLIDLGLL